MQVGSNTNQTNVYAQYTQMKLQNKEDLKSNYTELRIQFQQSSSGFSAFSSDVQAQITQTPENQLDLNQQDF